MRQDFPIYLMRHARTANGALGRFQGAQDNPLDDAGRKQAAIAAARISERSIKFRESVLISSPLKRAFQTAEYLRQEVDIWEGEAIVENAIAEMSFGEWEGLTTHEVKARFPEQRKARKADRWNYAPPGGESYADMALKLTTWLEEVEYPLFAVTHSGCIRVIANIAGGMERERALTLEVDHCSIWRLQGGKISLVRGLPSSGEMSVSALDKQG